jgi:hypothetical protein
LAKPNGTKDVWLIASDQITDVTTFDDYGLRHWSQVKSSGNLSRCERARE